MLRIPSKNQTRQRVHDRIRKKVMGPPQRPRLNVYRSLNHIYVQLIDDLEGETLAAALRPDNGQGERGSGGPCGLGEDGRKKDCRLRQTKRRYQSRVRSWRLH